MPVTKVPKSEDFMEWYNEVVELAELTDKRYPIKGMNIWRPYGQKIMSQIDQFTRAEMARTDHDEVSFPLLIPEKLFMKEADQIKGFGAEVFWVTHAGENELPDGERWVVRPTSECAMYEIFPLWIRSHNDLPLQTYQICNVFRYETKQTRAFMRVREIHFFEDHSVFATETEAREHVALDLEIVKNVYDKLALPALQSRRPDWDKFPGAVDSTGADVIMPSGRALQCATVHYYGTNFAEAYDMTYERDMIEALAEIEECLPAGYKAREIRVEAAAKGDKRGITKANFVKVERPDGSFFSVGAPRPGFAVAEVKADVLLPEGWLGPTDSPTFASHLVTIDGHPVRWPRYRGKLYCHQTTYGMSERLVGAVVGCHGDDTGLILPPQIAPIQIAVVPIIRGDSGAAVMAYANDVVARLKTMGFRVKLDDRDRSPGDKYYHWELRGVPLRLEVGPKDMEHESVFAARRDVPGRDGKKPIPLAELQDGVQALLDDIHQSLYDRQKGFLDTRIKHCTALDEAKSIDGSEPIQFIFTMPICGDTCATDVEKSMDIKTLGVPVDETFDAASCAVCGNDAEVTIRFARTY